MTSVGESAALRILVVAPLVAPINEATGQIGGAQVLLADLAQGLASRGHVVTLLAVRGSAVPGVRVVHLELEESALRPASFVPGAPRGDDAEQERAFARVRTWLDTHAAELDAVHAHAFDAPAFRALRGSSVPVVHTLHLPPLDPGIVRAAAEVDDALMVTVSETNARAWRAAGVRVYAVVPNGIALEQIPVGDGGGRLLYAGRISPEKGADVAIRAARAAGRSLILVGGVYDAEFFERAVQPFLGADARHLGRRPRPEVYRLMGESAALVMPIRWDEPFGLVAAEAQAAGTPVVGYARGALPEVVVDGRTGYLVSPEDEGALVDAIHRVEAIERAECRRNAERFSGVAMVRAYEELYVSRVRR